MKEKLQQDIEKLREELAQVQNPEEFADHFQALNATIDQLEKDADLEQSEELGDQLAQVVTQFEVDHPRIHKLISSVIKTLGDIGI